MRVRSRIKGMLTRLCLCYVVGYLVVSGLALLVAPHEAFRLLGSTGEYGEVMPRWVAMMSLALASLIGAAVRYRLKAIYPLGFFLPAGMAVGFFGLYKLSGDPLFLAVLAVVSFGVVLTGASMYTERRASPS